MSNAAEESYNKTSGNPNFGQDAIPARMSEATENPIVEARFYVTAIKLVPISTPLENPDGTIRPWQDGSTTVMGGQVDMSAAKHGTFGKATPNGSCQMLIQNPGAFAVFKDAFESTVKKNGQTPRFRVYFVLDEDQSRS